MIFIKVNNASGVATGGWRVPPKNLGTTPPPHPCAPLIEIWAPAIAAHIKTLVPSHYFPIFTSAPKPKTLEMPLNRAQEIIC